MKVSIDAPDAQAVSLAQEATSRPRVSFFEPVLLLVSICLSVLGAIIGMQLIVTLGISANTSIIGALMAIVFSRIPMAVTRRFRVLERQNLMQTAISSATFGAANSLMIPLGVPFAMGMPELVTPMLIGAIAAMLVDGAMLYNLFGSRIFPATGSWPAGVATAEAIWAGDRGGRKAAFLGLGVAAGIGGALMGVPMSAFGAAFLGNLAALTMFGIGLLVRGYSIPILHVDIAAAYIPHGLMIGAGIVALFQVAREIHRSRAGAATDPRNLEMTSARARRVLSGGFVAYMLVALLISVLAGHITELTPAMLIGFVIYAAFAAYAHELIVGIAAMHSGWFPAFAVALITLTIGIVIGFPPSALAVLAGFSAATGPAFADMGYDLKPVICCEARAATWQPNWLAVASNCSLEWQVSWSRRSSSSSSTITSFRAACCRRWTAFMPHRSKRGHRWKLPAIWRSGPFQARCFNGLADRNVNSASCFQPAC